MNLLNARRQGLEDKLSLVEQKLSAMKRQAAPDKRAMLLLREELERHRQLIDMIDQHMHPQESEEGAARSPYRH